MGNSCSSIITFNGMDVVASPCILVGRVANKHSTLTWPKWPARTLSTAVGSRSIRMARGTNRPGQCIRKHQNIVKHSCRPERAGLVQSCIHDDLIGGVGEMTIHATSCMIAAAALSDLYLIMINSD